jgi:hypothetical protein
VGSVFDWALDKHTCESLQNFVMLLNLYFTPLDQIVNMSLNDLRKRVATRDKTQTRTQMDESLVALDLGHRFSTSGVPLLSFHFQKNHLLEDLRH